MNCFRLPLIVEQTVDTLNACLKLRGDVLTRFPRTWHSRFQGTPVKQILRTVFHKALVNDIRLSVGLLHTVILYRKNTPFLINSVINLSLGSFMPNM